MDSNRTQRARKKCDALHTNHLPEAEEKVRGSLWMTKRRYPSQKAIWAQGRSIY
jgi:hypothetical protein